MSTDIRDLRAAVVGTGFIGAVHVEALRRLGVEVVGVVGSSPERARAKLLAPVIPSYEELLRDERVDVVHLTTPNYLHHSQVKQALEAGKHVVCEKPLAMTSEESAELLELAELSGLVHCTVPASLVSPIRSAATREGRYLIPDASRLTSTVVGRRLRIVTWRPPCPVLVDLQSSSTTVRS